MIIMTNKKRENDDYNDKQEKQEDIIITNKKREEDDYNDKQEKQEDDYNRSSQDLETWKEGFVI